MREADTARDRGDATHAATLYGMVVERWGPTFDLLVQHGNALKDSGSFERAEQAYQAALEIRPRDADCHLQFGHLMKLAGRLDQAEAFYREAHQIDPASTVIAAELRAIEAKQRAAYVPRETDFALAPSPMTAMPPTAPVWNCAMLRAADRGSRSVIIRDRIMDELVRRRN